MRVETVRRILDRAEAAVAQLAARTENEPAIQRSQAVMYNLFAETYLRLGATKLAADYAGKAIAITRALVAKDPANTQWQRDLAINLNAAGDVKWEQGDLAGALAAYRESLVLLRALDAKEPGGYREMSVALNNIGDVLAEQGDRTGALAAYRQALGFSRARAAKEPDNPAPQRDVSVGLNKIGDMLVAQGDRAGRFSRGSRS
jgi:tetratricopeptide (TPR) repeat protein